MNIFEDIEKEHEVFDKAAGSLVTMINEYNASNSAALKQDIITFCNFFIDFMVGFHTKKEETLIFAALEKLHLPSDRGPLFYYTQEHKEHLKHLNEILLILNNGEVDDGSKKNLYEKGKQFCCEVWEHIDKENSVLMVEVVDRIRGGALLEMNKNYESFLSTFKFAGLTAEAWLKTAGEMITKYKPVLSLPDFIRGDGCMSCRFYGADCEGIEHEWWTEHEWEDFFERNKRD